MKCEICGKREATEVIMVRYKVSNYCPEPLPWTKLIVCKECAKK